LCVCQDDCAMSNHLRNILSAPSVYLRVLCGEEYKLQSRRAAPQFAPDDGGDSSRGLTDGLTALDVDVNVADVRDRPALLTVVEVVRALASVNLQPAVAGASAFAAAVGSNLGGPGRERKAHGSRQVVKRRDRRPTPHRDKCDDRGIEPLVGCFDDGRTELLMQCRPVTGHVDPRCFERSFEL